MGDTTPEPSARRLLSHFTAQREPGGRMVIRAASPVGPLIGCAVPAAVVAVAGLVIGAGGVTVLVLLFAVIVITVLLYNGARAWVCGVETIQQGIAIGPRQWYPRTQQPASAVVLKREMWRSNRGSTDMVLVEVAPQRLMKILSVHNWAGQESRLASGGRGTLSRSGAMVPAASEPLKKAQDTSLLWLASEAVRELTELLHREIGAPLRFECNDVPFKPRGR